jgi:hypothetical protein
MPVLHGEQPWFKKLAGLAESQTGAFGEALFSGFGKKF